MQSATISRHWTLCLPLLLLVCGQGCEGCDRIDPPGVPQVPCGFVEVTQDVLSPADPCVSGEPIVEPFQFPRTSGPPDLFAETFVLPHPGRVCVHITNVAGDAGRIASARVGIDGTEIIGPADFNQNVIEIDRPFPADADEVLATGEHALDARLTSNPGASLIVEVRFARVFTETESAAIAELGALEQAACEQFNEELTFHDPAVGHQALQTAAQLGMVAGQMAVRLNAYQVPRLLDPLPHEDFGQLSSDPPEIVATKWLDRHRLLFHWSNPQVEVVFDYNKPSRHGPVHVRFKERISGLTVDNAQLEVVVRASQVQRFVGHFVPETPTTMVPAITADEAAGLAAASSAAPPDAQVSGAPVLALFDSSVRTNRPGVALAWRVRLLSGPGALMRLPVVVPALAPPSLAALIWIDAVTGNVLGSRRLGEASFEVSAYRAIENPFVMNSQNDPLGTPVTFVLDPLVGIDLGCLDAPLDAYEWCRTWINGAGGLDLQWRGNFGRKGWSNDGIPGTPDEPGIPADDRYRAVLDPFGLPAAGIGGIWFSSSATNPWYGAPGPFVALAPGAVGILPPDFFFSADTLRHELGHALLGVELGDRGSEPTDPFMPGFGEHAGDFWAMACFAGCGDPFRDEAALSADSQSPKNHAILECNSHYHGDFSGDGFVPGNCPLVCDEFVHRNFWVDDYETAFVPGVLPAAVYKYACVLDAVAYRAIDDRASVTAHGVTSRGLGNEPAQFVFYEIFTNSNRGDDVFTWEHNYRRAVATLAEKCGSVGGPPCRDDRDVPADGMDPYWGVGFWSQPQNLTTTDIFIQSARDPAAVTVGGEIFLFVIGPDDPPGSGNLSMVRFTDPFDRTKTAEITNLSATSLPDSRFALGIAAAAPASGGKITIAYMTNEPFPAANLRVAHFDLASETWSLDSTPALTTTVSRPGKPAIGYAGDLWVVAYQQILLPDLGLIDQDAVGVTDCGIIGGATDFASRPYLLSAPFGLELLYHVQSNVRARRIDALAGISTCLTERLFVQLDLVPSAFEEPRTSLDLLARTLEPGTGGPTAAMFPPSAPRLQVFMPSVYGVGLAERRDLRQISLGVPPAGSDLVYAAGTETRLVTVVEEAANGAAGIPLVYEHPLLGPVLLLYRRGGPGSSSDNHIFMSYKKSD